MATHGGQDQEDVNVHNASVGNCENNDGTQPQESRSFAEDAGMSGAGFGRRLLHRIFGCWFSQSRGPAAGEHGSQSLDGNHRRADDDHQDGTTVIPLDITRSQMIFLCIALAIYIFDVGSDVNLAYAFWSAGSSMYFILTMTWIVAPYVPLILSWLCLLLPRGNAPDLLTCCQISLGLGKKIILTPILPVMTHCWALMAAWRFQRQKKIHRCTITKEDVLRTQDGTTPPSFPLHSHSCVETYKEFVTYVSGQINVFMTFEVYLESAPQLLLQLYLLLGSVVQGAVNEDTVVQQVVSIIFSTLGLAWAPVGRIRGERLKQHTLASFGYGPTILRLLAELCFLISRFLALSLFAAMFDEWLFLALALHIGFTMPISVVYLRYNCSCCSESRNKLREFLVSLFVTLASVFSLHAWNTARKCLYLYFSVYFIEQTILIMLAWVLYPYNDGGSHSAPQWLKIGSIVGSFVSFVLFLLFLFLCVHFDPNRRIQNEPNNTARQTDPTEPDEVQEQNEGAGEANISPLV